MPKPKKVTRRWDAYVNEAKQPPFELVVDDDKTITITAPTGGQIIDAEKTYREGGGIADAITTVCGDAADDVLKVVRDAPASAMNQLLLDLMDHFKVAEAMQGEVDSRT